MTTLMEQFGSGCAGLVPPTDLLFDDEGVGADMDVPGLGRGDVASSSRATS